MTSFQLAMEITGVQLGYHGNRWAWDNPPQCSLTCGKWVCSLGCGHDCVSRGLLNMFFLLVLWPAWRGLSKISLWKNYGEHRVWAICTPSVKVSSSCELKQTERFSMHRHESSYLKSLLSCLQSQIKVGFWCSDSLVKWCKGGVWWEAIPGRGVCSRITLLIVSSSTEPFRADAVRRKTWVSDWTL